MATSHSTMVSRAVGGKRYLQAGIAILEKETFICAGFRKTSQRRQPPVFYVGCVWAEARPALRRDRRARRSVRSCAAARSPEPAFPGRLLWAWRRRQHGGAPDGDASGQTKVSWAEGDELVRRGDGAGRAWAWRVCKQEGKGS